MITGLGFLILLAAAALCFAPLRVIFAALIISLPFTATSVADIGLGRAPLVISPSMIFAVIFIVRGVFAGRQATTSRGLAVALYGLMLVPLVSIAINYVWPVAVQGFDIFTQRAISSSTEITRSTWTQTAYWWLWISVIAVAHVRKNLLNLDWFKISLGTAVFVSIWGIAQFAFSALGLSFPNTLFANSTSPFLQGYLQLIPGTEIGRVTSVAAEPSFLSAYLTMILAWVLYRNALSDKKNKINRILIALLIVCTGLSTSTTGYIGLLTILMAYGIFSTYKAFKNFKLNRGSLISLMAILFLAIPAAAIILVTQWEKIYVFTLGKATSGSFSARTGTIAATLKLVEEAPVFGGSIGPVTAFSLPIWLLGSLGALGLLAFLVFLGVTLNRAARFQSVTGRATMGMILTWLLVTTIAGFPFQYGMFWMPFILLAAINNLNPQPASMWFPRVRLTLTR